jgi:hypothetical protein
VEVSVTYICVPWHALSIFGAADMGDELQRCVYPCVSVRYSTCNYDFLIMRGL